MSAAHTLSHPNTGIVESVNAQIRSRRNAVAIRSQDRELIYAEFGIQANRITQLLRSANIKKGDIVALCLSPSPEFITAAFAIMSVGAAYLPIDENCPAERLSFIISDSQARLLFTRTHPQQTLRSLISVPMLVLDSIGRDQSYRETPVPVDIHPDNLAYVIYTSGSTGRPKGVEITHRGLSNLVAWHNEAFQVNSKDRASQIAGLAFDAAVWEIWPYLVAGATLCIPEPTIRQDPIRLQHWLITERITVAFAPTVLAERLMPLEWPRKTALRILLTGGEALRAYPGKRLPFSLVNNYGPTECTVVATSGRVSLEDVSCTAPAIGWPIAHAEIHILSADLKAVKSGETGEICIGGPALARGYRNRPELTADRFIPNPFSTVPGSRLYRTGDLGTMREDRQLRFLGRVDDQVKIRGCLVEPNEIAVAMGRHSSVRQCIVIARECDEGEKQLVAYVVPSGIVPVDQLEMREFLAKSLPDYMIPSAFVTLDELPLTANGKINQSALPVPARDHAPGLPKPLSPITSLERQIDAIVRNLLRVDGIGIQDNFFLLGGHSLFGAELIGRLAKCFNIEVPLRTVFESPTIASLALRIERLQSEQAASTES